MPSCIDLLGLLVLLGGVLASPLPDQHVEHGLKKLHESIAKKLGLTEFEVNQDPPFDFVIKTINTSCQRKDDMQLMNATLDVYMRVFSNMLHHTHHHGDDQSEGLLGSLRESERSNVRSDLTELQDKIKSLKDRLICQNQYREETLRRLENIQVNDPLMQKKALAQFLQIYQVASTVAGSRSAAAAK